MSGPGPSPGSWPEEVGTRGSGGKGPRSRLVRSVGLAVYGCRSRVCGGLGLWPVNGAQVDHRVMTLDLMCPNCGAVIQVPDANQPVGYLQSHGHHGRPPSLHMHGGGVLLHECVLSDDWLGGPALPSGATRPEGR